MSAPLDQARLTRQSYGIACAGNNFGGPRGIWLECRGEGCLASDLIVGSRFEGDPYTDITDTEAGEIFRRHGWTGEGERLLKARCPKCSQPSPDEA